MEISMTALALEFLYSIILGVFLGIIYDAIRLLRVMRGTYKKSEIKTNEIPEFIQRYIRLPKKKLVKKKKGTFFVAVGDVLFFVFSACAFSIFAYHFNDGVIRGFALFGMIFGFFVYYFTVGKLVLFLSFQIVNFVKMVFSYAFFLLIFPFFYIFEKIYTVFCSLICKISLIIYKTYVIIYIHRYSDRIHRRLVSFSNGLV